MASQDSIKKLETIIAIIILAVLFFRHTSTGTEFVFDVAASILGVILFYIYYKKINQNLWSYTFFLSFLILHNLALYETTLFGIRFDKYIHFYAGITLGFIINNALSEKMTAIKRAFLVILISLGVGAITEILEWLGYGILGAGDGFFFYGIGDVGEWQNSITDMISNFFGVFLFAISRFLVLPKGKKYLEKLKKVF